jgi:hypothetical protein
MQLSDLSFQLYQYHKSSKLPQQSFWPKTIELDSKLLQYFEFLYRRTYSSLCEYKFHIVDAHHELFATPLLWGNKSSVTYKSKTNLTYKKISDTVYEKQILHNSKLLKKTKVAKASLKDRSYVFYTLDAHSHPAKIVANQRRYTFFSSKDLTNLSKAHGFLKGLATNEVWLCAKTLDFVSKFKNHKEEEMKNISGKYFSQSSDFLFTLRNFSRKYGMVFYKAGFGSSFVRID